MFRHQEGMDLTATPALAAFADMPPSLLHVHAGMLIYLVFQLLLGARRGAIVAATAALLFALLYEGVNWLAAEPLGWEVTRGNMVLTVFWPTMCYAVSRLRRGQRARQARRSAAMQSALLAAAAHG
jgi:hypothetical protein